MTDPIPTAFITLPEALQRIANCISEAHVESAELEAHEKQKIMAKCLGGHGRSSSNGLNALKLRDDNHTFPYLSKDALFDWDRRNLAVTKLKLALQAGAISAIVRSPVTGEIFRLLASDWCFQPFCEEIIRGGVIHYPILGFEPHSGRTVFLDKLCLGEWLAANVTNWATTSSKQELCCKWLTQEMHVSPNDKQKSKDAWYTQAKHKYDVSRREFNRAWTHAIGKSGCNWSRPGAPNKSSR